MKKHRYSNSNKPNYHGLTKQEYMMHLCKLIVLKIPYEQDRLLLDYGCEISQALISYLHNTTKENLEMIYKRMFDFKISFNEDLKTFNLKFEYLH